MALFQSHLPANYFASRIEEENPSVWTMGWVGFIANLVNTLIMYLSVINTVIVVHYITRLKAMMIGDQTHMFIRKRDLFTLEPLAIIYALSTLLLAIAFTVLLFKPVYLKYREPMLIGMSVIIGVELLLVQWRELAGEWDRPYELFFETVNGHIFGYIISIGTLMIPPKMFLANYVQPYHIKSAAEME